MGFCGFELDTAKQVIEEKAIGPDGEDTVGKCLSIGKFAPVGSSLLWEFLTKHKSKRFEHNGMQPWHSIEKTNEE